MVETENGGSDGPAAPTAAGTPAPAADIVKQVEYYFGDVNLARDKFLIAEIGKNDGGWVDMSTMMKFNRLAKLAANQEDVVLDALAEVEDGDGLMEVDREGKRIRRKESRPLPADREQYLSDLAARTVYIKGLDKDWELDQVTEFLRPHATVESVYMRRWKADPGVKNFKGSCLLTFPTAAAAEAFLALPDLKCGDNELIRKWKNDWALEKDEEIKTRRERQKQAKMDKKGGKGSQNNDTKAANGAGDKKDEADAKPAARSPPKKRKFEEGDGDGQPAEDESAEKKLKTDDDEKADKMEEEGGDGEDESGDEEEEEKAEDELGFYPGSVFKLKGIPKEGVHVRDIRTMLNKFEAGDVQVAYVSWTSGDEEAVVRLKERDTAKKALEAIAAKPDDLVVKDVKLTVAELVGDEEKKFLSEARQGRKDALSAKRGRGGGRGRGGRGRGGRGRGRGRGGGRGRGRGGRWR